MMANELRGPQSTVGDSRGDPDVAGMAWWNNLPEADRRYWCLAAITAVPAEAWKYFRLVTAPRKMANVTTDGN